MGKIHNRIEIFVNLVEDIVSEKSDYISVASFRPTMGPSESKAEMWIWLGWGEQTGKDGYVGRTLVAH